MTAIICAALIALCAQDKDTDVVQLKDGSLLVGKITKVDEKGLTIELKTGGRVERAFADLAPYSGYKIKAARIDHNDGGAHLGLADFCLQVGLYGQAVTEIDRAVELDPKLADAASKKRAEARNEDGRSRFEEAKKLVAEKRYEDASKALSTLVEKYGDTEYAGEARKEMAKVADEIRKENEQRQKDLEARQRAKDDAKKVKAEEGEKAALGAVSEALDDAKKQWAEGLDWEGKGNLTKADRAFKTAEAKLSACKRGTEQLLKAADAGAVKAAKDLDKEVDSWMVRTCWRLGRMWAAETNYTEALLWLNRGIKLAPDDQLMNETLLTITQVQIRRRSVMSGGGTPNPKE